MPYVVRAMATAAFLALAIGLPVSGLAQSATTGLSTGSSDVWGTYVTDSAGHTLYLYVLDEGAEGGFACVGACTNNWIPLTATSLADLSLAGVDGELVAVQERADGTLQVTYGGWPLYRSRRDVEPGQTRGQSVGNQFFIVSLEGVAITATLEQATVEVSAEAFSSLKAEGLTLFGRYCVACHGSEGLGGAGPRLAGRLALESSAFVIETIIQGRLHHGMPAFGPYLTDREIAAIATYVRNAWGNEFGATLEEEVAPLR
jgi:mono/diheme cytochrome c family protein